MLNLNISKTSRTDHSPGFAPKGTPGKSILLSSGVPKMTEQEMVDALNTLKEPHYQRHDSKEPDPCGHWNCTYHGLCLLAEYRLNIMATKMANDDPTDVDEIIVHLIRTSNGISRESLCRCGHRCASSKWQGKHTYTGCVCVAE